MDETETTDTGEENATEDSTDRIQQQTISELDRADQIAERQARENTRREAIMDREESLHARKLVGGIAEAGQVAEKPKVLSDTEYAEALERGEVNPLKEDGII